MKLSRRKIKRTCPRCKQRHLVRIVARGGLGGVRLLTRNCLSCHYVDGHGWELVPTSEDRALDMAKLLGLDHIALV